jgi:hypothetical protein
MRLLFERDDLSWGLRGDPFLWEEMAQMLTEEPLPANLTQLITLIERSFEQLVGDSLHSPKQSIYVLRYDHGGVSGGYVCLKFWNSEIIPEIQLKYLEYRTAVKPSAQLPTGFVMKGPRFIDKPCRYEFYPGGCRFGASCRFRHSDAIRVVPFHIGRSIMSKPPSGDASFQHNSRDLLKTASTSSYELVNANSSVGSSLNTIFSRAPQQYNSSVTPLTYPVIEDALSSQYARGNSHLGNHGQFKHL